MRVLLTADSSGIVSNLALRIVQECPELLLPGGATPAIMGLRDSPPPPVPYEPRRRPRPAGGSPAERLMERKRVEHLRARVVRSLPR